MVKSADLCLHGSAQHSVVCSVYRFLSVWKVLFHFQLQLPLLHSAVWTACPSWHQQRHWYLTCCQLFARPEREKRDRRPSALTLKAKCGVFILRHIYVFGQWEEGRVPRENPTLATERDPAPKTRKAIIFTEWCYYNIVITLHDDLNIVIILNCKTSGHY